MNTAGIGTKNTEASAFEYSEPVKIAEYELCTRWGRSPRSLLTWRNQGKMPDFHRNDARRVFYYLADIEEIEKRRPELIA